MADRKKINILDRVFSQYIRLRDSVDGYIICCSCGKYVPWKEADAGHWINRKWMSVRWDERNVHAQCRACNRFDEGALPEYTMFMMKKYGQSTLAILLAMKRQTQKWTDFDIDILIKEYRQKIKDMS